MSSARNQEMTFSLTVIVIRARRWHQEDLGADQKKIDH